MIERYVLGFREVDKTQVAVAGGMGARLGELSRIEGVRVPAGFCVTTDAFRRIMAEAPSIDDRLDRLSLLNPGDREAVRTLSTKIRRTLDGIAIPDDLAAAAGSAARARAPTSSPHGSSCAASPSACKPPRSKPTSSRANCSRTCAHSHQRFSTKPASDQSLPHS